MDDFGHTEADALAWFQKCRYDSFALDFCPTMTQSLLIAIYSHFMHSYSSDASMRVNYTQLLQSVDTLKTVGLVPDKFTVEKLWTSLSGEVNPIITRDITV